MQDQLHLRGPVWEMDQRGKAARGERRSYQLLELYDDHASVTVFVRCHVLIFTETTDTDINVFLGDSKTEQTQLLWFRMYARAGAATYYYSYRMGRRETYRCFNCARDPSGYENLKAVRRCLLDPLFAVVVEW